MRQAVSIPVTVKCRIGVDDQDPELALRATDRRCADAGVTSFAVHARKAWLEGLSPKENRDVPPLDYDLVHRVKLENPGLEIVLNGGITTLDEAEKHLTRFDGVMLGRAAYQNAAILAEVDARFFGGEIRDMDGGGGLLRLCRRQTGRRRAPEQHDQAHAGTVQWPPWRARLPPPSERECDARRCRNFGAARRPGNGAITPGRLTPVFAQQSR
jgi:tRNA-dihydrouridine synthase